jgi:hypothetical protein|tara:strand:- start:76 stop:876 length:801 start_codon:yes stop_codon:yes gene_type:complete
MKKGRFSKEEIVFIKENCNSMSYDSIAIKLNRDPESVESFVISKLGKNISSEAQKEWQASYDLKNRPYWKDLKEQFDPDELEMLVYHWGRIIGQFKDDVLPTEELQVIDAIKLEILMNRALKEQQAGMQDIRRFEELIKEEKTVDDDQWDRDYIFNLERQIAVCRAAQESLSKDYKELGAKKSGMLKDLKATREQRIRRLEDSKRTFFGWIQQIMRNRDFRTQLGIDMEKMRLASEKEYERLSEYHEYEDGGVDQPLFTPENFKTS